jgi:predicted small secreted protein
MKKALVIIPVMILALSLLTACGNGGTSGGSGGTSGGDGIFAPSETTRPPAGHTPEPKDPCPCCPDCIQEECDCKKCNDSDDCKCASGSLSDYPPITYVIEIAADLTCLECSFDGCGMDTFGTVMVTMNWIDDQTGYFGSAEGIGETIKNGTHVNRDGVAHGDLPPYVFTAHLFVPNEKKPFIGLGDDYQTVFIGIDKVSPDDATVDWRNWGAGMVTAPSYLTFVIEDLFADPGPSDTGTAYPDPEKGLIIFEMPLMDTPIGVIFSWNGILNFTITLIPADG